MEKTAEKEVKTQGVENQAVTEKVTMKTITAWVNGFKKLKKAELLGEDDSKLVESMAKRAVNKLIGW